MSVTVDQRGRLLERRRPSQLGNASEPGNRHRRQRSAAIRSRSRQHSKSAHGAGEPDRPHRWQSPVPGSRAGAGRAALVRPRKALRQETASRPSRLPRRALRLGPLDEGTRSPSGTSGQAFCRLRRSLPGHRRSAPPCTKCSGARRAIHSSPNRTRRTRTRSARSCSDAQRSCRSSRAPGTTVCVGSTTDCRPAHSRCPGRIPPGSSSRNRSSASIARQVAGY